MLGSELVDQLTGKVIHAGLTSTAALAALTRAAYTIAAELPLPALETSSTVDTVTDGYSISLPANYHSWLYLARNPETTDPAIVVYQGFQNFYHVHPRLGESGSVIGVCTRAGNLLYANVPGEVTTLTLHYYKKPTDIALDAVPDLFNDNDRQVGESALFHRAAADQYGLIEDAFETDGRQPNSDYHEGRYEFFKEKLRQANREGVSRRRPPKVRGSYL